MADDNKQLANDEVEFNPLVVIVAEQPERYESFAQAIVKGGFKCEVFGELPEEMIENPISGTIYFVSFNLKTFDASLLARRIEQKGNLCIVFAEQLGVETAAKLSSAKMAQTLQHPYTEKNFLMAVQTVVKKRRVQHEKDLRKQSVLDRRKGMAEAAAEVDESSKSRIFKGEGRPEREPTPLIFEDRILGKKFSAVVEGRGVFANYASFARDRRKRGLMEIQKGLVSAKFMVMPSAAAGDGRVSISSARANELGDVAQANRKSDSLGSVHQKGETSEVKTATQGAAKTTAMKATSGETLSPDFSVQTARAKTEADSATQASSAGLRAGATPTRAANERASTTSDSDSQILRAKREGEVLVGYTKDDLLDGRRKNPLVDGTPTSKDEKKEARAQAAEVPKMAEVTKIAGPIVVPTWALIAAATIGILFLLFFLYQMMFQRH